VSIARLGITGGSTMKTGGESVRFMVALVDFAVVVDDLRASKFNL
jgi:hypothetical protein